MKCCFRRRFCFSFPSPSSMEWLIKPRFPSTRYQEIWAPPKMATFSFKLQSTVQLLSLSSSRIFDRNIHSSYFFIEKCQIIWVHLPSMLLGPETYWSRKVSCIQIADKTAEVWYKSCGRASKGVDFWQSALEDAHTALKRIAIFLINFRFWNNMGLWCLFLQNKINASFMHVCSQVTQGDRFQKNRPISPAFGVFPQKGTWARWVSFSWHHRSLASWVLAFCSSPNLNRGFCLQRILLWAVEKNKSDDVVACFVKKSPYPCGLLTTSRY